jgi:hypothetical protein
MSHKYYRQKYRVYSSGMGEISLSKEMIKNIPVLFG